MITENNVKNKNRAKDTENQPQSKRTRLSCRKHLVEENKKVRNLNKKKTYFRSRTLKSRLK